MPGKINHPTVIEAANHVVAQAKLKGKTSGTQISRPTRENLALTKAQDYNFIVLSSDIFLLWEWAERINHLISLE